MKKDFGLKFEKEIYARSLLEALDIVSIPEGYFLREGEELLRFLRENFKLGSEIKILSIGCGRGEEVYTIKYLCEVLSLRCFVVGVDISLRNLKMAKSGMYTSFSLRGMKENFLIRWGNLWRVPENLRENTEFVLGNIFKLPFKDNSFDAVVCRNLLIHINPEYVKPAVENVKKISAKVHWGIFDSVILKSLNVL